jgi:hypothetical protein
MKGFCKDRRYFEATSKGYDATMKRAAKANLLEMGDLLRNKRLLLKYLRRTSLCSD